jgi:hypothetical protein
VVSRCAISIRRTRAAPREDTVDVVRMGGATAGRLTFESRLALVGMCETSGGDGPRSLITRLVALDSRVALIRLRERTRRCGTSAGTTGYGERGSGGAVLGQKGLRLHPLRRRDCRGARSLRLRSLSRLPRRARHPGHVRVGESQHRLEQPTALAGTPTTPQVALVALHRGYERPRVGLAGTLLRCAECGAKSDQLATGWRAFLVEEDDYEPEFEESRIRAVVPALR